MTNAFTYKLVDAVDKTAVKSLWEYCFNDTPEFVNWYFTHYYEVKNTLGVFDGNKLLASAQLIPYTISLRDVLLSTAYIVGVDTAPEARRLGLAKELLLTSLDEMQKRDQLLALLMPFEASFYAAYQWSFCYTQHHYHFKITELKNLCQNYGELVNSNPVDYIPVLDTIYQLFVQHKNGYILRTPKHWEHLLADYEMSGMHCYILYGETDPEAYIFYYFEQDTLVVHEMAFTNFKAKAGLFAFIYGHRSQKTFLKWMAPSDDSSYLNLPTSKEATTLFPFAMVRIVDVAKLLERLSYPFDLLPIVLCIKDSLASWNNACFSLTIKDSKATAKKLAKPVTPDLTLELEGLNLLVMGTFDCLQLIDSGLLTVHNPSILNDFARLWPKMTNYINEYY